MFLYTEVLLNIIFNFMFQDVIDVEVKKLLELKVEFKKATGTDWKPGVQFPAIVKPQNVSPPKGSSRDDLLTKITVQGDKIRKFKSEKADKSIIDSEVKTLLALKTDFKLLTGEDWQPGLKPSQPNSESVKSLEDELNSKITEQGDKVRKLKSSKAAKDAVDAEVKILLSLKAQYKAATGKDWKPGQTPSKTKITVENTELPAEMANSDAMGDSNDVAALTLRITDQGNLVRQLKSSGADKVSV